MAQHSQLVAILCLAVFGLIGVITAILWRGRSFRIVPIVFAGGVLFWVVGLLLVSQQIHALNSFATIQAWPVTDGTVVESRVIGDRALRANIVYSYVVNNATFRDSTDLDEPAFGGKNIKRQEAETIAAAYPVGARVSVHYNPVNPNDSVLRTSPDWAIFGKMGLGSFLFGAGLFLAVSYFRRRTGAPPVVR